MNRAEEIRKVEQRTARHLATEHRLDDQIGRLMARRVANEEALARLYARRHALTTGSILQ